MRKPDKSLTQILTQTKKGTQPIKLNPLVSLARLAGFEPATYGFVVRHSIQLSYRRIVLSVVLYPKFFQSTRGFFRKKSQEKISLQLLIGGIVPFHKFYMVICRGHFRCRLYPDLCTVFIFHLKQLFPLIIEKIF